jgi:ferritin-like metal-binding protein YciE
MAEMKTLISLQDLLAYESGRFLLTEITLKNNLGYLVNQVDSLELKMLLEHYQKMVDQHLQSIQKINQDNQTGAGTISKPIIQSFLDEIHEKMNKCADHAVMDACILTGVQGITQFKMSAYHTASQFAGELNMNSYSKAFEQAGEDEKEMEGRLAKLSGTIIHGAGAPQVLSL